MAARPCCEACRWRWPLAVSYTHLDVYKRQHYAIEPRTALQDFRPPASGVLGHRAPQPAVAACRGGVAPELMPMLDGHRAATV